MQSESQDTTFNKIMRFALCLLLLAPVISISAVIVLVVPSTITPFRIVGSDHLISVTSIYVDEVPLPLNPSLLEGGAKLSTVVPYTVLQTDIYNALAQSLTLKATRLFLN
ncbi:hypothetical protein YC2023_119337 [Brassica napus]